jgi:hypothetical protein
MIESDQNIDTNQTNQALNLRITAVWAVSEAGLGGVLHAFHAPFKGLVLTCFAVTCISLLAWYNRDKPFSVLVRAWAVVMAVKFAVAPLSPITAYVAVSFQAFFGWACYRYIRHFPTACMIAAVVSLLESALQRLLLVTVAFGMDIWQGKAQFSGQAIADKVVLGMAQKSVPLMLIYVAIHVAAGFVAGWLAGRLPRDIDKERVWLGQLEEPPVLRMTEKEIKKAEKQAQKKEKAWWSPYVVPMILVAVGTFNLIQGKGGWSLFRIALVWIVFFTPFVQQYLVKWVQRLVFNISNPYQSDIQYAHLQLPEIKNRVRLAWQVAADEESNKIRRMRRFVPLAFALTLQ